MSNRIWLVAKQAAGRHSPDCRSSWVVDWVVAWASWLAAENSLFFPTKPIPKTAHNRSEILRLWFALYRMIISICLCRLTISYSRSALRKVSEMLYTEYGLKTPQWRQFIRFHLQLTFQLCWNDERKLQRIKIFPNFPVEMQSDSIAYRAAFKASASSPGHRNIIQSNSTPPFICTLALNFLNCFKLFSNSSRRIAVNRFC